MKSKLLVCVPFTGLGLYGGFRGNRWLRNRITVFKEYVIPSLQAQTDQDFVLWVAWRKEEYNNKYVKELQYWLFSTVKQQVVFTYSGVPFWDDKYDDETARERLYRTLVGALPGLMEPMSDCDEVYWLLQPSDDLYHKETIHSVKEAFAEKTCQAVTYTQGYICDYTSKRVLEYNPKTNPPFFAIRFPRNVFFDPGKHINYIGPYKSHEYVGDKLVLGKFQGRGFMVGTHGENISTHFNHPYGGEEVHPEILDEFGIRDAPLLTLPVSVRKKILRRLPYRVQRKLRYIFGEKIYSRIYNFLRN